MSKSHVVLSIIRGYIPLIFFSLIGFFGGMCIGIGEMGSIIMAICVLPISLIIELIRSIYYYKKYKNTENKFIYFLRFSIFIFIMTVFLGYAYKVAEINNTKNYLRNAENIVEKYRTSNNIEILSENDFKNINLPESITIEIFDDGYLLSYKYAIYHNKNGEGGVRVKRN
jgi:hypothetical protein